jgi:pyroglutamyl-peptidase
MGHSVTTLPRIVLTGFGPFPAVADNATARLVPTVAKAARALFPGYAIVSEVLPTEWQRAPERLRSLAQSGDVALMLHFGVAESADGFRLERIAHNVQAARKDAAGELPAAACVLEQYSGKLSATFPAERIAERLNSLGLPCTTSDNAGSYLCNALLFHSLATARELPAPYLAGFVHIPEGLIGHGLGGRGHRPDCPLDWRMAVTGSLEIVAVCLDEIAEQRTPLRAG